MKILQRAAIALFLAILCATAPAEAQSQHRKVAILLFDGIEILDFTGPYEVFGSAGYDVFTVAASKKPVTTYLGMQVMPQFTFADAPQADVVVIPGGGVSDAAVSPATLQWIKTETVKAQHTMSVCNGAFILANAGLLDGLSATTTYGWIPTLRAKYSKIKVIADRRWADNGKIITTAGLSAGIDGALHVVALMDGEASAQQVALGIEYDWRPRDGFVRAALADRLIPRVDLSQIGQASLEWTEGDRDHWKIATRLASNLSSDAVVDRIRAAYAKAYAAKGNWNPGVRLSASGKTASNIQFTDREGHSWNGVLAIDSSGKSGLYTVSYTTKRAD